MPAALIWSIVGALVNVVPWTRPALVVLTIYALYYGALESSGRPGLPPPGLKWQVPSHWVRQVSTLRRSLVWGSLLGPGFATRNPYAGFGVLVLIVASMGDLQRGVALAASVGLLHGLGRVTALLTNLRMLVPSRYTESILRSMRWRSFDGLALLLVAGVAVMTLAVGG